jgi:hypothetical protein
MKTQSGRTTSLINHVIDASTSEHLLDYSLISRINLHRRSCATEIMILSLSLPLSPRFIVLIMFSLLDNWLNQKVNVAHSLLPLLEWSRISPNLMST